MKEMTDQQALALWRKALQDNASVVIKRTPADFESTEPWVVVLKDNERFVMGGFFSVFAATNFCVHNKLPISRDDSVAFIRDARGVAAQEAFESFDFTFLVSDADGFEAVDSQEYSRIVYTEEGERLSFTVRFKDESIVPYEVFALMISTGSEVGFYPQAFAENTAPV